MTDTVGVHNLHRTDAALAAMVDDPSRLDRERDVRFQVRGDDDDPPPPYRESDSLATTEFPSPVHEPVDDRELEERRLRDRAIAYQAWSASLPYKRFASQAWLERQDFFTPGSNHRFRRDFDIQSRDIVRARWKARGIWIDAWDEEGVGYQWKHQLPLVPEPDSDDEEEAEEEEEDHQWNIFAAPRPRPRPRPPPPQLSEEEQWAADMRRMERFTELARQREQSRPLFQFIAEIADETQRIWRRQRATAAAEAGERPPSRPTRPTYTECRYWPVALPTPHDLSAQNMREHDISTQVYNIVKDRWVREGIWIKTWGVLPGMTWKHELPKLEVARLDMGDDVFARLLPESIEHLTRFPLVDENGPYSCHRRRRRRWQRIDPLVPVHSFPCTAFNVFGAQVNEDAAVLRPPQEPVEVALMEQPVPIPAGSVSPVEQLDMPMPDGSASPVEQPDIPIPAGSASPVEQHNNGELPQDPPADPEPQATPRRTSSRLAARKLAAEEAAVSEAVAAARRPAAAGRGVKNQKQKVVAGPRSVPQRTKVVKPASGKQQQQKRKQKQKQQRNKRTLAAGRKRTSRK